MQFHLDGFTPGDPRIRPAAAGAEGRPTEALPETVDVLIVGAGPTGLTLAAQLAAFPDIATAIIERRPGPLALGQADGIACRTMEMFEAFGFSEHVMREAYWVNETVFWKPDPVRPGRIARSGRIADTEEGLSEFPHVILNQARVHDHFLAVMRNAPTRLAPAHARSLIALHVDDDPAASHPVSARIARDGADGAEGGIETVRARHVVGCDGARSSVRKALGLELHGDAANQAWGVMDVLAVTDFPDIRLKAAVHSAEEGNLLVIPREGGYLVRLYIELDKLNPDERIASRSITVADLIAAAGRILHPYTLEVKEVAWWSVYEIGQRLCPHFDDAPGAGTPRVFIAGDACHTHSPKAGQGMNVSMADGFNLGWKLAAVLREQCTPELLRTYSEERQGVARELIDFDREFARMFSARPAAAGESGADAVDPAEFQRYFVKHGRFTAGTAITYAPSLITGTPEHQHLATGFATGTRFHSAPVIRLADARSMHLGHTIKADGRWRLFAFADGDAPEGGLRALCGFLSDDPASPIRRHTPPGADRDCVIDLRAVLQQPHRDLAVGSLPPLLLPRKGRYGLRDYEKVFCPDPRADIFDMRGIDRARGCVVVVRPDQYVAAIRPLDDHDGLASFFARFMCPAAGA